MAIKIPFCRPVILPEDKRSACRALGPDIASGKWVSALEETCKKKFGGEWVAVSSGTAALRICALLVAPMLRDKFAYIPWSFHATEEALQGVLPCARVEQTYNKINDIGGWELNLPDVPVNVVSVTLGGIPFTTNGNVLFSDDCQSFGVFPSSWQRQAFSFSASKIVTSGHGGIIRLEDPKEATVARQIRSHMKVGKEYVHKGFGFNYMMPDHSAALVLSQVKRIDCILADRYDNMLRLQTKLAMPGIFGPTIRMPIFRTRGARTAAAARCHRAGIEVRLPYQGHTTYSNVGLFLPTQILSGPEIDMIAKAVNP